MKRLSAVIVLSLVVLSLLVSPALANPGSKVPNDPPNSTTLDACNYFVGVETPTQTKEYTHDGVTYRSEKGNWTGVSNNPGGPVESLGPVSGTYRYEKVTAADGTITGTESFHSKAGKIDQVFAFDGSWHVSVVATEELSFLTSDTNPANGGCYTGPFPRP